MNECDMPLLSLLKPMRPVCVSYEGKIDYLIENVYLWGTQSTMTWTGAQSLVFIVLKLVTFVSVSFRVQTEHLQMQVEAKATAVDTTYIRSVNYASTFPVGYELSHYYKRTI